MPQKKENEKISLTEVIVLQENDARELSKIRSKRRLDSVTRYSVYCSGTTYLSQPTSL